ncbi:hypothetical protein B566_EDAN010148 [Ephemera danica]|nr:hypothetical protein B566_EDAN010148 [Ephemera danica]
MKPSLAGTDEWGRLHVAVRGLAQRVPLAPGQLTTLHEDVRTLQRSMAGPFIREYLETRLLAVAGEIMLNEGQRLSVRQTALVAFRDRVVLPLHEKITAMLEELGPHATPATLRQMLLVLQSVTEVYPPSERRLQLESLVALAVTPYLGFRGLYENGCLEPTVPSEELTVAQQRRPSDLTGGCMSGCCGESRDWHGLQHISTLETSRAVVVLVSFLALVAAGGYESEGGNFGGHQGGGGEDGGFGEAGGLSEGLELGGGAGGGGHHDLKGYAFSYVNVHKPKTFTVPVYKYVLHDEHHGGQEQGGGAAGLEQGGGDFGGHEGFGGGQQEDFGHHY